jgi:hypothetical protein
MSLIIKQPEREGRGIAIKYTNKRQDWGKTRRDENS